LVRVVRHPFTVGPADLAIVDELLFAANYTGTIPAGVKVIYIECVFENGKYRMNITW
jgi:hypothetical protein